MQKIAKFVIAAGFYAASALTGFADTEKPTIVLVHGAFADSSSWNRVVTRLERDGYNVKAVANPLRGVKTDGEYVAGVIKALKGQVVLVGHSYGGSVISDAAAGAQNVKALVFVAAFAPEKGESAADLSGKFPGSTLAPTLAEPVVLPSGEKDLYIEQGKFPDQFAADVPVVTARLMAVAQRPITDTALAEPATEAAWEAIPSWFIYGDADKNIPPKALQWMADRAKSRRTVAVQGASHVVMISHPGEVTKLIEEAASAI
ncbi:MULTISPECIES: alpha/beta fold hydrolase [Rhizobium]|jgi:pimeloyl-ACP methyl ester carboxylesterase|uniref:alpha/beta fold hydrolase n=1 Tax=Rhizobium TaxID=379 RepID=UPI001040AB7E|nr:MULTISPECIES: alpha/beta hydrolase [Rhizobium]MBY5312490.1 alpha/beta hydrolase [Rhizobium leguminosarum]NEH97060.1 alpha/beta fold hydrolase [Rhizobium leguminosarum]NEI08647.1 alpha/beta fold hydrolase [Rhizobium ruizarguesonis]NEI54142.1 alpha/beta fold hydrolase [Rhizobium leguminosarum]NEI82363.1 alpha/beta fold hydrolase [Rhizobium leguminosarum]